MESLPREIIVNEILLRLTLKEILSLSEVDRRFLSLGVDGELWRRLTERDYPEEVKFNPGADWQDYYIEVHQSPILPIYHREDPIALRRLTPYNLEGVIEFIEGLGIRGSHIVFTDSFVNPLAHFKEGELIIVDGTLPWRKIILLPQSKPVDRESLLTEITTTTYLGRHRRHTRYLHGYIDEDGELLLSPFALLHDGRINGTHSHHLDDRYLQRLLLQDKFGTERLCTIIEKRLRSMGRIVNEVYVPVSKETHS